MRKADATTEGSKKRKRNIDANILQGAKSYEPLHSDRILDLEKQTDASLLDGGDSSQQLDDSRRLNLELETSTLRNDSTAVIHR
jgi:hypothetical protein